MKYTVKDTHIRHNDRTYGPGSVVELTEEEVTPIRHHLVPTEDAKEPLADGKAEDEKINVLDIKRRKK